MRQSLTFSLGACATGIPENPSSDDPEALLKDFMISKLKLPPDTVDSITFHRVHRLGGPKSKRPQPIIAKLEHYKHKNIIKSKARELKGSNFGINDQFPKEINDRRKILYLIMKQHRE
ncbi:hypothetical protein LDENG_00285300 [Lucifuga dentata]|nr:hypothetical protein LDENG_00285300 [Lucifuga dentata]